MVKSSHSTTSYHHLYSKTYSIQLRDNSRANWRPTGVLGTRSRSKAWKRRCVAIILRRCSNHALIIWVAGPHSMSQLSFCHRNDGEKKINRFFFIMSSRNEKLSKHILRKTYVGIHWENTLPLRVGKKWYVSIVVWQHVITTFELWVKVAKNPNVTPQLPLQVSNRIQTNRLNQIQYL